MTPRERVLAAFALEEPDRVPRWCGASPEFWAGAKAALGLDDEGLRERFGDDFRRVWPRAPWDLWATGRCLPADGVSSAVCERRRGVGDGPLTRRVCRAALSAAAGR